MLYDQGVTSSVVNDKMAETSFSNNPVYASVQAPKSENSSKDVELKFKPNVYDEAKPIKDRTPSTEPPAKATRTEVPAESGRLKESQIYGQASSTLKSEGGSYNEEKHLVTADDGKEESNTCRPYLSFLFLIMPLLALVISIVALILVLLAVAGAIPIVQVNLIERLNVNISLCSGR